IAFGPVAVQFVGNLDQATGAVSRQWVRTARAAVVEILEDQQSVADDLVRLRAFEVSNKADAAGVMLVGGVVEPLGLGRSGHVRSPFFVRRRGSPTRAPASGRFHRVRQAGIRGGTGPSQR